MNKSCISYFYRKAYNIRLLKKKYVKKIDLNFSDKQLIKKNLYPDYLTVKKKNFVNVLLT